MPDLPEPPSWYGQDPVPAEGPHDQGHAFPQPGQPQPGQPQPGQPEPGPVQPGPDQPAGTQVPGPPPSRPSVGWAEPVDGPAAGAGSPSASGTPEASGSTASGPTAWGAPVGGGNSAVVRGPARMRTALASGGLIVLLLVVGAFFLGRATAPSSPASSTVACSGTQPCIPGQDGTPGGVLPFGDRDGDGFGRRQFGNGGGFGQFGGGTTGGGPAGSGTTGGGTTGGGTAGSGTTGGGTGTSGSVNT